MPAPLFFKQTMARSRRGGTRAKLSGALGSNIYLVRRTAAGNTEQVVQSRPESREYSNTDAQVKARMIMGQIQRMFHLIPDLIKTGFATIPMGTLSLQHFSKMNRPLLADDYDTHYYTYGAFDWQEKRSMVAPAGCWKLTEGQWPEINPDHVHVVANVPTDVEFSYDYTYHYATYGDLLEHMKLQPGDRIYVVMFRKDGEEMTPSIDIHFFEASKSYPLNTLLEDVAENELFTYHGDMDANNFADPDSLTFTFGITAQDIEPKVVIACFAFIRFRKNTDGSILFSSSSFQWYSAEPWRYFPMHAPYDVFDSWKNMRPIHRLPEKYQEVQWLKKVSTKQWSWSNSFDPSYMSVECYCSFGQNGNIYAVGGGSDKNRLSLQSFRQRACIYYRTLTNALTRVDLSSFVVGQKSYYKCVPNPNGFDIISDFGDISVSHNRWYTAEPLLSLRLFGSDGQTSQFTLWEIKIRDIRDDSLIYNLVPCYRKSDNIAGFYDLVTNQFLAPNTIVGDYEIGPNV